MTHTTTIKLTVEVNSDELRHWADRHADANHLGVAHVLYAAASAMESGELPAWMGEQA